MQLHHVPTFSMSFQASIIDTVFPYLQIQYMYYIEIQGVLDYHDLDYHNPCDTIIDKKFHILKYISWIFY